MDQWLAVRCYPFIHPLLSTLDLGPRYPHYAVDVALVPLQLHPAAISADQLEQHVSGNSLHRAVSNLGSRQ